MKLENKIIVITGGTKGLGKELALGFAKLQVQVIVSAHTEDGVQNLTENNILFVKADSRNEKDIVNLANTVIENYGRIDIWINNAGVFHTFSVDDEFIDMEKAHAIIDTNLFGTIFGCRTALKVMKKNGTGTIVNILSTAALDATRAQNAKIYAASKWAIRGYLQAVEAENADSGISFISVYPGGTKTELYGEVKPASFYDYMEADSVAEKIIANLNNENPEKEQIIKRPSK